MSEGANWGKQNKTKKETKIKDNLNLYQIRAEMNHDMFSKALSTNYVAKIRCDILSIRPVRCING